MWVVKLTKPLPRANSFRAGFFPRKVRYKADALKLLAEARAEGADGVVERAARVSAGRPAGGA